MSVLFAVAAVLLDLLVQMFAVSATGAAVAGVVRGEALGAGFFGCLAVGCHWVLVRRIRAGSRTLHIVRAGSEEVSTISWGHFVSDALFVLVLGAMLVAMLELPWGTAERAGVVAMIVACLALFGLRVAVARRAD